MKEEQETRCPDWVVVSTLEGAGAGGGEKTLWGRGEGGRGKGTTV